MSENNQFGRLLRTYRLQSVDPQHKKSNKVLTQARFAELLKKETGITYTLATISNWERSKSQIHQDDRLLLVGLIKVLHGYHGIKTLNEANTLLKAGNYRALNEDEKNQINRRWHHAHPPRINAAMSYAKSDIPLDTVPKPTPLPPCSYLPLRPNPFFVGRKALLRQIAKIFNQGENPPTVIITGLGGVGKTQLAIEFGQRYGQYFPGGVFWLNFSNPKDIISEIAVCGGADGLALDPDFENLPLSEQVKLVKRAWRDPISRLLIFDNCSNEEQLAQYRPSTGGCAVLSTSRQGYWSPTLDITQLPLPTLTRQASITLLQQFLPEIQPDEANAIAEELGDLPLALHLAGYFMAHYRHVITPANYLHQLQSNTCLQHPSLVGHGITQLPTSHERHVGQTFFLSYNQLDSKHRVDKQAKALLVWAAHLAPGEPIPRPLFLTMLNIQSQDLESTLLAEDSLHRLIKLGLLEERATGFLYLHRLLATFVKQLHSDGSIQTTIDSALITLLSQQIDESGYLGSIHMLASHLHFATNKALSRTDKLAAELCHWSGIHLRDLGEYTAALPYLKRAVEIRESVLGSHHSATAESLNHLGWLYYRVGKLTSAKTYLEQALSIRIELFSLDHPDTAQSLNNLGWLLWKQGNLNEAQSLLEEALRIRQQLLGEEHAETARSLNSLAGLLWAKGDCMAALPLLKRALLIREKRLGMNHPRTADLLNNLGLLLKTQKDYQSARPYLERSLAIREASLSAEHLHVAYSLTNLGHLLQLQGNYTDAYPLLERALTIRQQKLGKEHPETAESLHNLGLLLYEAGHAQKADTYLRQALTIQEKTLGGEHPATINTRLAVNQQQQMVRAIP